ncbi:MAG TPA: PqqD family protein [Longimicrobiales bacterium]|nr:PqqD family protein [Longimicrobiales bacterium]
MSSSRTIGPDTVVSRSDEPVAVELDGTVVMMSIEQGMYFGLEGVGPRVWALLDEPRSVRAVCDALVQEFDVEEDTCLPEIVAFLNELRKAQLIHVHGDETLPIRDR